MRKSHLAYVLAAGIGAIGFAHVSTAAAAGSIKGSVKMTGSAPPAAELNMKGDPFCAKQGARKDEQLVVDAGKGIKNVVVRITKGAPVAAGAGKGDVTLDQNGCTYSPRIAVVEAGQTLLIKNSDQTLHNVHTYKGPATLFNQAQPQGLPPLKKKFPTAGDVIKFKCDVHPWMTAYAVVTDNPFYAVTGADGSFDIKDVPPGKYTVEAWHERLGTKTMEVTVADGKSEPLKFELAGK